MDRDELVKAWHHYGKTYNIFKPEDQPTPQGEGWDRPIPEPSDTGTFDPQLMKHWRLFSATREFLCQRYEEYSILVGPSLKFDCLVPKFQPLKDDHPDWYANVLRITITPDGETAFRCRERECPRSMCKFKRRKYLDIFSLIQVFHGYRSVGKARKIVADAFKVTLGHFDYRELDRKSIQVRRAVPKWAIDALIKKYSGMKKQHVPKLIEEANALIRDAQEVVLDHQRVFSNYFAFFWPKIIERDTLSRINSAAIRLYLWLLVEQEERARRNDYRMKFKEVEIAEKLGVSRKTAGIYLQQLEKKGVLEIKHGIWTVNFG